MVNFSAEIGWRDWISPHIHLLPELEGQTLAKCGRISIWYGKNHPKRNNSQTPRAWILAVWCVIPTPVATLGRVFLTTPLIACSFSPVPRPMGASGRSPFGMGRVLAWQSSTIPRYVWISFEKNTTKVWPHPKKVFKHHVLLGEKHSQLSDVPLYWLVLIGILIIAYVNHCVTRVLVTVHAVLILLSWVLYEIMLGA